MAKKAKKLAHHTKWQPEPNNAIQLTTLRWYALTIERLAVEIYATYPDSFGDLTIALRESVERLQRLAPPSPNFGSDDCPDGWLLCRDGLCSPMCDSVMAARKA